MTALVVYESMFGSTKAVANAVAAGIAPVLDVQVREVGSAPTVIGDDVTLLVVGGPTHAFGMSRPGTRRSAEDQAPHELVSQGDGVREWLSELHPGHSRAAVATFDTRISRPRIPGSAAAGAEKRLRRLGLHVVARPESFWVTGTTEPIEASELERARRWGQKLASEVTARL